MRNILIYCILCIISFGCTTNNTNNKVLWKKYETYFPIGTAVSFPMLTNECEPIINKQFNSITCENEMKPEHIHPEEGWYNWSDADSIVNYALKNGKLIRGHVLVWHQQTADWFFKDGDKKASKDLLLKRLKDHIQTIVSRYKGKIYAWDVVNEVIDDDSAIFYKNTTWFDICGEEFISKAFQYAHEADPGAKLYYNDYNTENPVKYKKICTLLKELKSAGVPIDGIGLQAHWSIYSPTKLELDNALQSYAALGLDIQITELDISLYKGEEKRRKKLPGETCQFTTQLDSIQTAQYNMVFEAFRKYRQNIKGVTFWGVSDKYSWLNDFPVEGRDNYPLLFNREMKPKKAFYKIQDF